jgi:polyhydroxybutyrate depolymerase
MRCVAATVTAVAGLLAIPSVAGAGEDAGSAPRSTGCGSGPVAAGVTVTTIDFEGAPREYRLAVPQGVDGDEPLPLILNWHGFGSDAIQQAVYSELEEKGPAAGYVVATPQGTGNPAFWNILPNLAAPDDVAYARALIDALAAAMCIDERRVYSTGMSNGGGMSAHLACNLGDRLAAIAPVAGINLVSGECPEGEGVSVIAFHGHADAVVPYPGGPPPVRVTNRALPAVEDAVAAWGELAGCRKKARVDNVSAHVVLTDYNRCRRGTDVQLYSVTDGGHTWPGSLDVPRLGPVTTEIDAADLMLEFFDEHPRRRN